MTQTLSVPAWCANLQTKLMAALDAAWAILDSSDDPIAIRQARDKAKAVGELAAMARKVAAIVPAGRAAQAATQSLTAPAPAWPVEIPPPIAEPVAAQVEHARRALEKLKGGRRGRL